MPRYDVAVVGLGAFGSAATYQLAKRGARVLGIDRFSPPHALGSTHGETRITRMAVGEGSRILAAGAAQPAAVESRSRRKTPNSRDTPVMRRCSINAAA